MNLKYTVVETEIITTTAIYEVDVPESGYSFTAEDQAIVLARNSPGPKALETARDLKFMVLKNVI